MQEPVFPKFLITFSFKYFLNNLFSNATNIFSINQSLDFAHNPVFTTKIKPRFTDKFSPHPMAKG